MRVSLILILVPVSSCRSECTPGGQLFITMKSCLKGEWTHAEQIVSEDGGDDSRMVRTFQEAKRVHGLTSKQAKEPAAQFRHFQNHANELLFYSYFPLHVKIVSIKPHANLQNDMKNSSHALKTITVMVENTS